ncbi:MAG: hypothetical protein C5S40_03265 [ANME-2 cluster archaeon]|nr:hypothetical protein [ANME-2 cluster archaeon]
MTSSKVARLSLPPEYDTLTGRFVDLETFLIKLCAFASKSSRIFRLAVTTSSHEWGTDSVTVSTIPLHLVLAATPLVASTISTPFILALPADTGTPSGDTTTTSAPGIIPGSASITPGASVLAPFCMNGTADSSITTQLRRPSISLNIRAAPSILGSSTHLPDSTSNLIFARATPLAMISSILSSDGTLFMMAIVQSGIIGLPNCAVAVALIWSISCWNAGLISPGGVTLTLPAGEPHAHVGSSTGRSHWGHQCSTIFPRYTFVMGHHMIEKYRNIVPDNIMI